MILYFIILIFCLVFPKETINISLETIRLWVQSVLPSLLPFFIISKVILYSDGIKYFQKMMRPLTSALKMPENLAFPFVMSLFCGYPTGSRILSSLNFPQKEEMQKSAEICFSSSPIFIIGTVGTVMLKSTKIGIELYVIHLCTLLLFTSFYKFKHTFELKEHKFSKNITDAISESVIAVLNICGYMVFFAIINKMISYILPNNQILNGFLGGIIEFTYGIKLLSAESFSLPLISFLLSFGGICVICQCLGFLKEINVLHFIATRLILGCIASILCAIYRKTALYVPIIITICVIIINNKRRK